MKKRIIACVLVLALAVSMLAVFAACKKKQPKKDFVIPEGGYDGSAVTIKFYSSMGQDYEKILSEYLTEFNTMFPNITIEHTRIGDYDSVRNQIKTELGNGKSPDVAFCYSDHVALYNKSRAVVTLDDLIASDIEVKHADGSKEILGLTDEQKNDFIETYYNEGKAFGDGKMYMLPFAKSTELMYYNKTSFDQWGLQVPDHWFASDGKQGLATSDKTSMEYALAFIKNKDSNCVPLGYDAGDNWLITLFEQFGTGYTSATGNHYLFDNQANYNLVATLRRWYQSGWFTTKGLLGGNTYTSTYFTSLTSEQGKKSYISIGSSAGAAKQVPSKVGGEYPFQVGVAMIPQKEAGMTSGSYSNCRVISQGPSICVFNSDDPQKVLAAWLLAKYLTTNAEFEARYGLNAGYLPVVKSVNDLEVYASAIENADTGEHMSGMAAKLCKEYKDAFFVSPAFYGSAEARSQMNTLLNQCVLISGSSDANVMEQIKTKFKNALAECEY